MRVQEYEERLQQIYEKLNFENAESYLAEMEELYSYKPVSLMWFVVKARLFMYMRRPKEAYAILGGMWTAYDNRECRLLVSKQYEETAKFCLDWKNVLRWGYSRMLENEPYGESAFDEDNFVYKSKRENIERLMMYAASHDLSNDMWMHVKNELYTIQELPLQQLCNDVIYRKKALGFGLEAWVRQHPNMGYFREVCLSTDTKIFIVIESEDEFCDSSKVAAKACLAMGHEVIYITKPVPVEVNETIGLDHTIEASLEEKKASDFGQMIPAIELICEGQSLGDNRDYLLEYLYQTRFRDTHVLVLCSGTLMDAISVQNPVRSHFQRLTPRIAPYLETTIQVAWFGNYLSYISDIYKTDVKELVNRKPECKFSIIIPARNSADTLLYTLQTCLEQSYSGSYEVLVNDNSTDGNMAVQALCKELGDARIRYVQTPRNLHLPKSFEFAYLQAKGEYIFALGSDDGILPWALDVLDQVTAQNPKEEVIQWERCFYAWPGFNGGQQHELVIPREYTIGQYDIFYLERADYIASILADPTNMYSLPMLYINSCFKRSYLTTLLKKTGRLWDGTCQDLYMGMATATVNDRILNMRYPLTIAGMSDGSVGANANRGKNQDQYTKNAARDCLDVNVGGYCQSYYEYFVPATGTDTWSLYTSFMRLISMGVLPEEYATELLNWEKIFIYLAKELDIQDVAYDRKLHDMRYVASLHGEEFLEWFNQMLYINDGELCQMQRKGSEGESKNEQIPRTYSPGKTVNGGTICDASEYDVTNIREAVSLVTKLMK